MSDPVQGTGQVGGWGGSPFWADRWNLASNQIGVVSRLSLWWNGGALLSLELLFSDGTVQGPFGNPTGDSASIDFAPGEIITDLTIWGNGNGTRAGHILFHTSKGQTFDHGKDTSGIHPFVMNVHSGILMGAYGNSGSDIDNLGLLFLSSKVANIHMSNFTYTPSLVGTMDDIKLVAVDNGIVSNTTSGPLTQTFAGSKKRQTTHSWESSTSNTWGVDVKIGLSVPILDVTGSFETGFKWEQTQTETTGTVITDETDLNWDTTIPLEAGQSVSVTAEVYEGSADISFSADVTLTLQDGSTYTYTDNTGQSKNVVFTKVKVVVGSDSSGQPTELLYPPVTKGFHKDHQGDNGKVIEPIIRPITSDLERKQAHSISAF